MTGCSAINCKNRTENGIRLFRFPANADRKEIWLRNVRRDKWVPSSGARLCEIHFEKSQFENNRKDGLIKLKPNAIPTLFNVPNPPHMIDPPLHKSLYKNRYTVTAVIDEVRSGTSEKSQTSLDELQISDQLVIKKEDDSDQSFGCEIKCETTEEDSGLDNTAAKKSQKEMDCDTDAFESLYLPQENEIDVSGFHAVDPLAIKRENGCGQEDGFEIKNENRYTVTTSSAVIDKLQSGTSEKNQTSLDKLQMGWTPDTVIILIECVKGNPSLYSVEDPNYKNKAVRMRIWMLIAEEVSVKRPGTTPAEVKKKWYIVRATYMSERRKMLDSCKSGVGSGEVYQPSLYYFDCMDFLSSSLQVHKSRDSLNEFHTSSLDNGTERNEQSCDMIVPCVSIPAPQVDFVVETETPARKRRRVLNDAVVNTLTATTSVLRRISSTPLRTPDPLDIYGMHVVNKLRTLNESQLLDVQYEIDSLIYDAYKNRM